MLFMRPFAVPLPHMVAVIFLVLIILWQSAAGAQEGLSHAENPALSPRLRRIDQDKLLEGDYPLRQVVENGRHLFSTPFTKAEGYGEGGRPDGNGGYEVGPREAMFRQNLAQLRDKLNPDLGTEALREFINFARPTVDARTGKLVYSYVRLNGLDSQSCFECHNTIGSERLPDARSYALTRKQSTVGGPAGFASNAFINPDLPNPLFKFIRNPPHVFGTGYAQELAEEMTQDLLHLKTGLLRLALENPSQRFEASLESKGTAFGSYAVTYTGDPDNRPSLEAAIKATNDEPCKNILGFRVECGKIEGVSPDLVVRPFQWKGIASNERNFVRDAAQFHFGMEAREKNPGFGTATEITDNDKDGVHNELLIGDVSALTIYTMTIRPPFETKGKTDSERDSVARGRRIFTGQEAVPASLACARCHTPSLTLNDATVVVRDPSIDIDQHGPVLLTNRAGLSATVASSSQLPAVRRYLALKPATVNRGPEAIRQARTSEEQLFFTDRDKRTEGYAFDLTTLQPANINDRANREHSDPLPETQPRLPATSNTIAVPLFSDLRRHKMGALLSERKGFLQDTDSMSVPGVAEDEFLTRPLWGVGDTGPWLHDGRAQSLKEAILLHESEGSEASDVVAAFRSLDEEAQRAVIDFLLTLRLPLDPRYSFDDYQ